MAVVVHCGSGPNRGHYISIVKSHGFWLLFDDDMVDVSNNGANIWIVLFFNTFHLVSVAVCRKSKRPPLKTSTA